MSAIQTVPQKVVDLIGYTNAALEKAAAEQAAIEKQAAQIATLLPECVKALIDNERIEPHQEKQALEALRNPVKAIEILTKVARHRNAAETPIGVPAAGADKTAADSGGSKLRESDRRLWQGLGLTPPKE